MSKNKITTHLEFVCSDEKAAALLRASRMYDEWAGTERRTSYDQVSKALCSKENATLEEFLKAVSQLKSRLAQVERERDAALKDIANTCWSCANAQPHQLSKFLYSCPYLKGKAGVRTQCENWQWRGVCPENTKEDAHESDYL